MSISLIEKNNPDYLNSNYLFSKNPVYWEFQRADFVCFNVQYGGLGNAYTNFRILERQDSTEFDYLSSLLIAGAVLNVQGSTYNGDCDLISKTVTITPIDGVLYNLIELVTSFEYAGNDANAIINLTALDTYRVKFKLTLGNGDVEYTNEIVPFNDGKLLINFQDYINKYITYRNNWQYDNINWGDSGMTVNAKIEAIIDYRGDDYLVTQLIDNLTFIYGANQSVNIYKSSAYLYKMIEGRFAKFLTMFSKLRVWEGYPVDVSMLFPESQITNLSRLITVGTTTTQDGFAKFSSGDNNNFMHRVNLTDIVKTCKLACGYAYEGVFEDDLYVELDYVLCDYVDPCSAYEYILRTETLDVEYIDKCNDYPIYLKWRNNVGGVDYWLFNCRYAESTKIFDTELRQVLEYDLSDDGGTIQVMNKRATKSITVQQDVLSADKDGFLSLLTSKHIQIYVSMNGTEYRWQDVALSETEFKLNIFNKMYSLKFTLNLGELYI